MGSKGRGKRSEPKLQREPPALEVQRGHKAAEAQHLAVARDKKMLSARQSKIWWRWRPPERPPLALAVM
jgi:hypothetical protein